MANGWRLEYSDFDPDAEGLREALCALGNGRFVTRGAAEESRADGVHYPGTYVAGGYNQLASEVSGRTVVNEDLVNLPNWLPLTFQPDGGDRCAPETVELLRHEQALDLRAGVLTRRWSVRDRDGRESDIESRRIVSMHAPQLAAIEWRLTPVNWSGGVRIISELDGTVTNQGVERYRQLSSRHLDLVESGPVASEGVFLLVSTTQSRIHVGIAARTRVESGDGCDAQRTVTGDGTARVGEEIRMEARAGEEIRVEKVVALYTSRDRGITEAALDARLAVTRAPDFSELLRQHSVRWDVLWRRCDIVFEGESGRESTREQMILRLHLFHLLQTISPHTAGLDVGAPARGLHGEAYRGHIFWDELFILPFFNEHFPAIARSLLLYRYHRLDAARELAREAGFTGAMFPWQSSSDGRETTQEVHLNPMSGRWDPDHSRLQRHINIAIAYNVVRYHEVTGDREFLANHGAELVLEIARFWVGLAKQNGRDGRWEIRGVMGPDEYHEKYPDAESGGLRNNAYTNVMAVWCVLRAMEMLDAVGPTRREELLELLNLGEKELERWDEFTHRVLVPFHDGVISQFEGYESLEEFDWDGYRERYGNIERLDRILKAENDTPDRYRLSKQADVDMLFFLLPVDELREIFERLGYSLDDSTIRRTIEFYSARTSHGSTLSRVVYASVIHHLDPTEGYRLFLEALRSDIDDVQGGTTAEGIHLGAMAGTVDIVRRHYAGVTVDRHGVSIDPALPEPIRRLSCSVRWRGRRLWIEVRRDGTRVLAEDDGGGEVPVRIRGSLHRLAPGVAVEVD
jgi:trehalose/maltose hydrolase-like predicted phosphorylase